MTYKIKPEFLELWGEDATEETILTEQDVEDIARGWDKTSADVMDQLIPCGCWYAVQRDCEDDWSTGSSSLTKAIQMARTQVGEYPDTQVAVIENDTCIDEIHDFSEDAWQMLYAFYGNPDWTELNNLIRFESGVDEPYCETEEDYLLARKDGFIKFDGKMTTVWGD